MKDVKVGLQNLTIIQLRISASDKLKNNSCVEILAFFVIIHVSTMMGPKFTESQFYCQNPIY